MAEGPVIAEREVDVLVIGAGPAGLGAATRLAELGVAPLVLDREPVPGGLPAQCEHPGFGLWAFRRLMVGREFAARLVERAGRAGVRIESETTVLEVTPERTVLAVSPSGLVRYRAQALLLATGCRERPRSTRLVPGPRPSGVFNTGVVQRLHTFLGLLPGWDVVIVGSDDISLVAARTLARAGCRIAAVVEERPYRQGYLANEWWSLRSLRIPLRLGHRVSRVLGDWRVRGVEVVPCDAEGRQTAESYEIPCDTVIFSGEFVPEATLVAQARIPSDPRTGGGPLVDQDFQTELPGIFACGNLVHAADPADYALADGERAALGVWRYLSSPPTGNERVQQVLPGTGVRAVVPQRLRWYGERLDPVTLAVRVEPAQRAVRLRAVVSGTRWGQAFAPAAKPHRSVYLRLRPEGPVDAPLTVEARGWPFA
ncbi:NAD(P)/FAD-dependent oxidoreductase [Thermomicrobiaceae bacterium CFH 74404]|uniref:NAD(P)/FAD-dependent oxidoreductase n=1 Tax=Thermalbibacter longus TaxID=2951981 RepID=A0AA41WCB5_9BACT|nr:FAD/NAD(P)-binding oxidoreductase [Thermalbibacter longus]MCM8750207.1 NAD(P)/FAD-dependent oxidoreductase [Thermalbibacter longus]